MHLLSQLRAKLGVIPRANARREARRFLATTVDCRQTQNDVLQRLIALNADSRFAKEHDLATVSNVDELRKRIPVVDYEYYRPYVDRMKQGQHSDLLGSQNKLLMFALTSGTTSGSKYIPITQQFLDDYRHGWQVWGIQALDAHPGVNSRQIVQISSNYDRFRTPGGTPCGNISGLVAAVQKKIVQTMYTVPGLVSQIQCPDAKNYTALRLALADDNVGMVMTANPSTLIHLAQLADAKKAELIKDIHDGQLSRVYDIDAGVRKKLTRKTSRQNRRRAQQLEQIIKNTGHLHPKEYWAGLQLIALWCGGSVSAYLPKLSQYYGDVPLRDHGLSASEGRMTIPIADGSPAGILDVSTHYFEFIPEQEYGTESPNVLSAHELEEGENYFILLTTSSGFYRYDICDVVRCVGYYNTTPMLEFLHKGAHISNLTGEKVSESQVVSAVRQTLETMNVSLEHFTVSPVWGEPPRYQLIVEESDIRPLPAGELLATAVDQQLQKINCEYKEKRQTRRLDRMKIMPIPDGTWKSFVRGRQQGLGGSLEQYKHPCLAPDLEFSTNLLNEHVLKTTVPAA